MATELVGELVPVGGGDPIPQQEGDAMVGADRAHTSGELERIALVEDAGVQDEPGDAADRQRGIELLAKACRIEPRRAEQQELAAGLGRIDRLVRAAHASFR